MQEGFHRHYGLEAIRRSLRHFVLGKSSRMLTSLALFVILLRALPIEEYAAYVSFQGLILAIGIITAIGVQKVLFRYLPELRATGNNRAAYRLLLAGMLLRTFVVSLLFLAILPLVPFLARLFHFEQWLWLFPVYLLMGYVRLTALWLSQCLESFLWQRESQYSLAAGGLVTASSVALLALYGELRLDLVVRAELAGETVALGLLLRGWHRRWRSDPQRDLGQPGWWRANRGRAVRYGAWSWLLGQSALAYGSAPNRLVAAHFMPGLDVAVLGAADNMMNLLRKSVPTRMLMSMVRPLAMARFAADGDFRRVTALSELVLRLNLSLLMLPVVVMVVVGPELMDWLTAGKYGAAGYLLVGFLLVLIAEGARDLVELMVQALEKYGVFFWTSLIQSASLLIAIPLLPWLGLWALVVANLVGTVLANALVILRLWRQGYTFEIHLDLMARVLVHALTSAGLGLLVWESTASLGATVLVMGLAYGALLLVRPPLTEGEQAALRSLVRRRIRPADARGGAEGSLT